jgi:hypothetical protein
MSKQVEFCYRWPDGRVEVRYRREYGTPECEKMIDEIHRIQGEAIKGGYDPAYFWQIEGSGE